MDEASSFYTQSDGSKNVRKAWNNKQFKLSSNEQTWNMIGGVDYLV